MSRKPLAIVVGMLMAQMSAPTFAEEQIETIKVWATEVENDSSLISDDIETKQVNHLSDLLRDQAGVDVGGTHSTVQVLNIRGVDDSDINITTDGVTQNNNIFHHTGSLLINADILKSVDIKVGTNSVLTGGLSGGVEFETKDAKDLLLPGESWGARLHTNYGSNDYLSSSLTMYSQFDDSWDGLAYFTFNDKDNPKDGDGEVLEGNDGRIKNGLVKLGWDVNDTSRLELKYDKYQDEGIYYMRTNLGSGYNIDNSETPRHTIYSRETMLLAYEYNNGDALKYRTTVYNSQLAYETTSTAISEHTGIKTVAESHFTAASIKQTARYGFEGDYLKAGRDTSSYRDKVHAAALYAEDEIKVTPKLTLTPGARLDYHSVDFYEDGTSSLQGLTKTYTDTTFGLSGQYLLTDAWTVKASSTQLFKGPGVRESYYKRSSSVDPDLKAETGVNNEIGLGYEQDSIVGLDKLGFSFNVFRTDIDDYINDQSNARGTYTNDGDYRIRGFETKLNLSKGNLTSRITYAHSDSDNKESGDALDNEVGDSVSLSLGMAMPEYNLMLNWTSMITFDLAAETSNDTEKEGYDVHDISATWTSQRIEGLTVTAGIENLFDEEYASHASSTLDSEPGRNIKLSASYMF